ncbi:hypothetical protein CUC08_Gglean010849 [Alternaria sp. MG1]|uniref:Uncharacterized protein n=1 Tax=Alternaria alternata TaxID=5599 RepID=A0A4Q4ND38_ALTAL|nr:hypothetical protein CUC08_Gglean010849 [Alternaria sp. MG1]RYN74292.1 hypothetical protein AA0117_g7212 [Alternaria alternata]RYO64156.1 hypothetical protein AA0116_g3556 [Alternaria tenuissima]
MAYAHSDDDDTYAGMHPSRQQRYQMLSSSTVASEDNASDSDEERDLFRLRFKLSVADRKNSDLEVEVQRLQSEIDTVKALNQNLEQEKATHTTTTSEAEALRAQMEVLEAALEHKDVELADITGAAQGISHSCARPQNSYDRLIVKLAAVRGDVHVAEQELDEATSQSSDNTASQGRIADLQRKLAVEEDKVARLTKANKLLTEQRSASEADAEFFRARLSNLEAEVQESRVSNSRTQRDPKRLLSGCSQAQVGVNIQTPRHATSQDRPEIEIEVPENEIEILKDKLNELRWNALDNVIDLDMANRAFRAFDCDHINTRNLPDGRNSSRLPNAGWVASSIFKDWKEDEQFVKVYSKRRQNVINHHKAHGRIQEGKGAKFWLLRDEFNYVDEKRGLDVVYK